MIHMHEIPPDPMLAYTDVVPPRGSIRLPLVEGKQCASPRWSSRQQGICLDLGPNAMLPTALSRSGRLRPPMIHC